MPETAAPFSAVAQRLSTRYQTSLCIGLFLAFAVVTLGIAAASTGVLRWIVAGCAASSFGLAGAAFANAFWRRPELLRSEEYQVFSRYAEWVQAADLDDHAKVAAVAGPLTTFLTHRPDAPGGEDAKEGEQDG